MNRGKSTLFSLISVFMMLILASSSIYALNFSYGADNGRDGAARTDIEVIGLKAVPQKAAYGDAVSFKFAIKNNGRTDATFNLAFFADMPLWDDSSIRIHDPILPVRPIKPSFEKQISLKAGETLTDVFTFTYNDSFPLHVRPTLVADPLNDLAETDEGNNIASIGIELYDASSVNGNDNGNSDFRRPDFTAKVEPVLDPLDPEIFVGDKVPFKVTIENKALPVLTTDFSIAFDDGTPSEMHNVFFEIGQTYSTVIEHKFAEPGVHHAKVFADPMDRQNEYDENNNIGTADVTVLEGEQTEHLIKIKDVTLHPGVEVEPGTWLGPEVTVENIGGQDIDGLQVVFEIPELNMDMDFVSDLSAGETMTVPYDMLDMMIPIGTQPDLYEAKVIVQQHNNFDWSEEKSVMFRVVDSSQDDPALPHAVLDVTPLNGTAPLNVTIDGSGSFDSDGEIVKHTLMIEGPNGYFFALLDVDGAPGVVKKTFRDAGEYHIQLIVEDNEAGGAIADEYVTVNAVDDGSNDDNGESNDNNSNDSDNNSSDDGNDNSSNDNNSDGNDAGPSILNRTVKEITQDSATITWTTNVDADARVEYGTDEDDLGDYESDNDMEEEHSIVLDDLDEDTKYYYTIKSCDEDDHCTEKGPYSFTTDVGDTSGDFGESALDSTWDDLYAQNTALFNGQDSGSDKADASDDVSDVVVTSSPSEPEIEVVFSPIKYIEVEEEVCGFKFLWWCLWKDTVTRQIPVPSMSGGTQFFI